MRDFGKAKSIFDSLPLKYFCDLLWRHTQWWYRDFVKKAYSIKQMNHMWKWKKWLLAKWCYLHHPYLWFLHNGAIVLKEEICSRGFSEYMLLRTPCYWTCLNGGNRIKICLLCIRGSFHSYFFLFQVMNINFFVDQLYTY